MNDRKQINVLFVCSDNTARSLMAEALLNRLGRPRFAAFSAGSAPDPEAEPDPRTIGALMEAGLPIAGLRAKRWTEYGAPTSPHMDLVVTLCDEAAGESPPELPGQPATAHWSHPDPRRVDGAYAAAAFRNALYEIRRHVELLVNLPDDRVHRLVLEAEARQVGLAASTSGSG